MQSLQLNLPMLYCSLQTTLPKQIDLLQCFLYIFQYIKSIIYCTHKQSLKLFIILPNLLLFRQHHSPLDLFLLIFILLISCFIPIRPTNFPFLQTSLKYQPILVFLHLLEISFRLFIN